MGLAPVVDVQAGQVLAVYEVQSGGTLNADLLAGASTLQLVDPVDFHELGGDLYLASADDASITSQVVTYNSADLTSGIVTLAVPWPSDWPTFAAGDYVWCSPLSTERRVDVALDGEADQLVTARIPFTHAAQIAVGVRPPDAGEWLTVGLTPLGYEVVDLEGEYPTTDPASVEITDPDTGEVIGELGGDAAFGTVTADAIYSDTVPYKNAGDLLLYVDAVNGNDDNDGTAFPPLLDTFERTVAPTGWGSADTGQAWAIATNGGNLIDVDAATGSGRLRTNGGGQNVFMRNPGFAPLDVELFAIVNFATVPLPAGAQDDELVARMVDSANFYSFSVRLNVGTLQTLIFSRVAGTVSTLAGAATISATPSSAQDWACRAQCQTNPDGGTDLRIKVWDNATPEPEAWTLTANDSTAVLQQPGPVGLTTRSGAAQVTTELVRYRSLLASCIDSGGNAIDTTLGGVGPLLTVTEGLNRIGDWNDGTVRILMGGTIDEQVNIVGVAGGGRVILDGGNVATVYGTVNVVRCPCYVELRQFTLQDTGDVAAPNTNNGSLEVLSSAYVYCYSLAIQSNSSRAANVFYYQGAHGLVDSCQLNGATARCLGVNEASIVHAQNNLGGNPTAAYRAAGGIIIANGTQPTGGNATTASGQIFTVGAGGTPPAGSGGTAPPTSSKKSVTVNADSSGTWRPAWGWRTDDDEAYQGEYAGSGGLSRGVAFYGTKLQRAGKTADSGKVYIKRSGYGGSSGGQGLYLCTFAQGSRPGGMPTIVDGPLSIGSLAWGAGQWFNLPTAWVQHLLNGGAQSIGLYHGSASPYVICDGRRNGVTRWQVKMTYH